MYENIIYKEYIQLMSAILVICKEIKKKTECIANILHFYIPRIKYILEEAHK